MVGVLRGLVGRENGLDSAQFEVQIKKYEMEGA